MISVSICVCTFRRDSLRDTLDSLMEIELPQGVEVEVVVIDNDAQPSARAAVDAFALTAPRPVRYVHRPGQNISVARNGALEAAAGRLVAFIDDDERATWRWLAALLRERVRSGADIVLGPVEAVYGRGAPAWMRRVRAHATSPVLIRGEIHTGYSGNVLIDLDSPALAGLRFDPALGQIGGEDTLFFGIAHSAGAHIGFAPDALVLEDVPDARLSFRWLGRRRFRTGRTHARFLLAVRGRTRRGALPLAFAKAVYCALATLACLPAQAARNAAALRFLFHAGVIAGLVDHESPVVAPLTLVRSAGE